MQKLEIALESSTCSTLETGCVFKICFGAFTTETCTGKNMILEHVLSLARSSRFLFVSDSRLAGCRLVPGECAHVEALTFHPTAQPACKVVSNIRD